MNTKLLCVAALALGVSATAFADDILAPGDNIIAVGGSLVVSSSYPDAEGPVNLADQDLTTKYLNFGGFNCGVIITPSLGATTVKSIRFATADDWEGRDPASYDLYGTNDEITSTDNSAGGQENWTLITSGTLSLSSDRKVWGDVTAFQNETSYTSYRLIFPTIKDSSANMMQIADVQMYETESPDLDPLSYNYDWGVLTIYDAVIAVQIPYKTDSSYATSDWKTSQPINAIDKNYANRYANFAIKNVGLAVSPTVGLSKIESFKLYTPTNLACCDPTGYQLFGTTDYLTSSDNSLGTNENWTLISEGALNMPTTRSTWCDDVFVDTSEYFRCYKLLFTGIRDESDEEATVVHISEMMFSGVLASSPVGDPILLPGDVAKPIHPTKKTVYYTFSNNSNNSSYPDAEYPARVIDGSTSTKYLNFGGAKSGFIVTPAASSTVQSFKMWTANDNAARDPMTFALYGTQDTIVTEDNGTGTEENWTLIAEGSVDLPTDRCAEGPLVTVENSAPYTSYKMIFTTLRRIGVDSHDMQLADIQFYSDAEGTSAILASTDTILAIQDPVPVEVRRMRIWESTQHAIDGETSTKYCNECGANSGIIFIPRNSLSIAKGIYIVTANDNATRDPMTFALYGTQDDIVSEDYGYGDDESWTLIAEGDLNPSEERKTRSDTTTFENEVAYKNYKILFTSVRAGDEDTAMQVAEVQLVGQILEAAPSNLLLPLDSGYTYIAICDCDILTPSSSHLDYEGAEYAVDNDSSTKYLNYGIYTNNIGLIIKPAESIGKIALGAISFTTANDYEGRDPASYKLYGTDEEITTEDNGSGLEENWTLVYESDLSLPSNRQSFTDLLWFSETTDAYKYWKIIFPTIKGIGGQKIVQIADVGLYDEIGNNILDGATAVACGTYANMSSYPGQEGPFAIADGNIKVKYLNYSGPHSGFIVTPNEAITPTAIMYTTANDAEGRDPISFILYGTDDTIVTEDNGLGTAENWVQIAESSIAIPSEFRYRNTDITYFENTKSYSSYKIVFTELKGITNDGMQAGEFYFFDLSEPEPKAPVITTQPISQTVEVGAEVTFAITATGTTPLAYQWQKDGTDIEGATSYSYTIAAAAETDAGVYTITVTNEAGSVTSDGATLVVGSEPSVSNPEIKTSYSDGTLTLTWESTEGTTWILQQTTDLNAGWETVTTSESGKYEIIVPAEGNLFFRLIEVTE